MLPSEVFFNNFLDSMDNDKKMQCDIYEKDNNINIEMDIPGFNKEDINIEINKGNLVVTAEKNEEENEDVTGVLTCALPILFLKKLKKKLKN
mgnify:CR=1 FL=1